MKSVIAKYFNIIPLLFLCLFYIVKAIHFPIHDFANYYFGAHFLIDGKFNSTIYLPYEFNKAISDIGYQNIFVSYAPNTPFLALFFTPLNLFSVATAKIIFNLFSSTLLSISCIRIFKFYNLNLKYLFLIPFAFFVPIKNNILFGQVYFLLFFLLSETLLSYEKKQFKKTAFYLSFAIAFKVFPIIFIFFFLFKKEFKLVLYAILFGILFLSISILCSGIDVWLFFISSVLPKASNGEIANSFVDNYQSVFMFLKRMFVFDTIENPKPLFHVSRYFPFLLLAFKFGLISLGYFITRSCKNNLHVFSFWILASILFSPYGSTYSFIVMLFPLITFLLSKISVLKKIILGAILFFINNFSVSFFIEKTFPFSFLRLFLLVAFSLLFLIYFFKKSTLVKSFAVSFFILLIGSFFKQETLEKNKPLLAEKTPILIYDYTVNDNQLTYFYWNEKGENKKSIPFKVATWKELDIKNEQVFYDNKQLTFDKNNKAKPLLINNTEVIFLSDEGRGIGFYNLRKIEL
ncbi:glycosyltransferase family 87 protein [Flavobacterium sp. J27]|uniref:glycosyltransferase family 87 protein n=1 Tax=Flavobacterium sp. J27 TaxID=2060419 RepID=UPI00103194D1|nr:glycosyltransferase family 87 protein [Flavobacterium sp. J27]